MKKKQKPKQKQRAQNIKRILNVQTKLTIISREHKLEL